MGYFVHTHDSNRECTIMESQSMQDIADGWSEDGDGIGAKEEQQLSSPPVQFLLDMEVSFIQHNDVCIQGSVISAPITGPFSMPALPQSSCYTLCLVDGSIEQVSLYILSIIAMNQDAPPSSQSSQLVLPSWIGDNKKVTLELDGTCKLGKLYMDDGKWSFVPHKEKYAVILLNFSLMYQSLLDQQLILPRWHSNFMPAAPVAHVSTSGLTYNCPESLIKDLSPNCSDRL
eukprot:15350212-Ditylum_brightwellii.AAC.1